MYSHLVTALTRNKITEHDFSFIFGNSDKEH